MESWLKGILLYYVIMLYIKCVCTVHCIYRNIVNCLVTVTLNMFRGFENIESSASTSQHTFMATSYLHKQCQAVSHIRQALTKVILFHKILLNCMLNKNEHCSCLHNSLLKRNRGILTSYFHVCKVIHMPLVFLRWSFVQKFLVQCPTELILV